MQLAFIGDSLLGAQRPLFMLLLAFIITFILTRLNTRLARLGIARRYRPGSVVTHGGLHIHHAVFGVVAMFVAGLLVIAVRPSSPWVELLAIAFGAGAALTLDEFALILHLEDVYWAGEGRASIDAVILAVTFMTLLLTGLLPRSLRGFDHLIKLPPGSMAAILILGFAFVVACYLKGKLFLGTIGIFIMPLAVVGAFRLARPSSPWARVGYRKRPSVMQRATRREERFDRRWRCYKVAIWDFIGGKPQVLVAAAETHAREGEAAAVSMANSDAVA